MALFAGSFIKGMFSVDTKQSDGNQEKRWEILLLQQCNLKRPPVSFLYLPGLSEGFIRENMGLTGSLCHITTRLNILKFYCACVYVCMVCDMQAHVGDSVLAKVRGHLSVKVLSFHLCVGLGLKLG